MNQTIKTIGINLVVGVASVLIALEIRKYLDKAKVAAPTAATTV